MPVSVATGDYPELSLTTLQQFLARAPSEQMSAFSSTSTLDGSVALSLTSPGRPAAVALDAGNNARFRGIGF